MPQSPEDELLLLADEALDKLARHGQARLTFDDWLSIGHALDVARRHAQLDARTRRESYRTILASGWTSIGNIDG